MPSSSQQPSLNAYDIHATLTGSQIVRDLLNDSRRGKAAARRCAEAREQREKKRDDESQRMLIMAECERLSLAFYEFVDLVLDCEMIAAGYHYHRGEWRKRRVPKEEPKQQTNQPANACEKPTVPKRPLAKQCPARRPMPVCKPLDCRCPLVRGSARRRRMVYRSSMRKSRVAAWSGRMLLRHQVAIAPEQPFRVNRSRTNRTGMIGQGKQPRPPPRACGL